jgi:hypothetical protein
MDKYPVAGNVIKIELWFGITMREALEAFTVPVTIFLVGRYIPFVPISSGTNLLLTVVGVFGGLFLLYIKQDGQSPLEYLKGLIFYTVTPNEYHHRRTEKHDVGKIQDVPISQINNHGEDEDSGE